MASAPQTPRPEDRRFAWERTLRLLDLHSTTKYVGLMLATYAAGATGRNAHPGEDRLAADCSLSERAVRTHLAKLRDAGLIVRTYRGRANQYGRTADVYDLTLPDDLATRVGLTEDHPALTARRYRNDGSGSGPVDDAQVIASAPPATGTTAHVLPEPDDLLPEPDDRATGTTVPPIKDEIKDGHHTGPTANHLAASTPDRAREVEHIEVQRPVRGHGFTADHRDLCRTCKEPQESDRHDGWGDASRAAV